MDAFTPLLILFGLAVAGASQLLSDRETRKFNRRMEWKAREAWMRGIGLSDALIQRVKKLRYSDVK